MGYMFIFALVSFSSPSDSAQMFQMHFFEWHARCGTVLYCIITTWGRVGDEEIGQKVFEKTSFFVMLLIDVRWQVILL